MKKIALIPSLSPEADFVDIAREVFEAGLDVVVVNDGSAPEYDYIFNAIGEFADVLGYRENHGKGYALKYALKHIKEKYAEEEYVVVTMDSDGQHKVSDALRVLDVAIENPNSLVLGSRKLDKSAPLKSRSGNFMARTTFLLFTGTKVYDTQTGLRAFNKKIIDTIIGAKGDRYEYEMNMLLDCVRAKIKIREVDIAVIYIDNNSGSHYNPLKDTMRIFWELIKFSLPTMITFLVGYAAFALLNLIPVSWAYWTLGASAIAGVFSYLIYLLINCRWIFKARGKPWQNALELSLAPIVFIAGGTGIFYLLANLANWNVYLTQFIVELAIVIVSWVVQRFSDVIKFSFSSLIGFAVDYAAFALLTLVPFSWAHWTLIANIIARVISSTVNFSLNYKWVFKSQDKVWKAALKYFALALFILACNTGFLYLLVDKAGMNQYLAKLLVEVVMFTVSWAIQKFFIFVKKDK